MDDSLSFYLLGCRACGNGGLVLVMPFGSAEERGKWATKHTQGTGHDSWFVYDQVRDVEEASCG